MREKNKFIMSLFLSGMLLTPAIASDNGKDEEINANDPPLKKRRVEQIVSVSSTNASASASSSLSSHSNNAAEELNLQAILEGLSDEIEINPEAAPFVLNILKTQPEDSLKNVNITTLRNLGYGLSQAGHLDETVFLYKLAAKNALIQYGGYYADAGEILCEQSKFNEAKVLFLQAIEHFNSEDGEEDNGSDLDKYNGKIKRLLAHIKSILNEYKAPQEHLDWLEEVGKEKGIVIPEYDEGSSDEENSGSDEEEFLED